MPRLHPSVKTWSFLDSAPCPLISLPVSLGQPLWQCIRPHTAVRPSKVSVAMHSIGTTVVLHSLDKAEDMNGKEATIADFVSVKIPLWPCYFDIDNHVHPGHGRKIHSHYGGLSRDFQGQTRQRHSRLSS